MKGKSDMTRKHSTRRPLVAALVGGAATILAVASTVPAATAEQVYYVPVTKSWRIAGHGFGHGHGMSQHGAQGAALQGMSYNQILSFYYPGTTMRSASGRVRVLISADYTNDVHVKPANGLTVRDLTSLSTYLLPVDPAIDGWRLIPAREGRTAVQFHKASGWARWAVPGRGTLPSDGEFFARGPVTLMVPSGSSLVPRAYRGSLRIARPYVGATVRDTINVLTLDDYVKGVVPDEMPPSWAAEALKSQAVAARTYGVWLRSKNPSRYYQICDTTACQVYGGVGAEEPSTNQAVAGTSRQILTYGDAPAFTQFSASSGGWTSDGGVPYMPAKADPYDGWSGNSVHTWSIDISTRSVEAAHPEIGELVALRVLSREGKGEWGGRVHQIVLDGTAEDAYITGDDFRWEHGLRSTWFSIAPTPIIARWTRIGGEASTVGRPVTGEFAVTTGSAQRFERGRIFWNPATGARELQGGFLKTYLQKGGPSSPVGWPRTGIVVAPNNGRKVFFQRGVMWAKSGLGAHMIYGPILTKLAEIGSVGGRAGYPLTSVYPVTNGQQAKFQHAVLTYNNRTRAVTVVYN